MSRFAGWIKALRANEPVRLYLLPIVAALTGTLVTKGVIDGTTEYLLLGLAAVVIGVPVGEAIRAKVTPTGKVAVILDQVAEQAAGAITTIEQQAQASGVAISPDIQRILDQAREAARYFDRGDHTR